MSVLTTLLPGFPGTTLPDWLAERLRDGLGGVCLFAPNITSLGQLRTLTDAIYTANPRAIIAIDEEGGDVTRLYADVGSPSPGNAVLGRLDDLTLTERDAAQIGWALRAAGCNVDFAPSVDINSNSDNPVIGVRSFGTDAVAVARHGVAWTTGLQTTGVAATAKHFPGHGDTAQDSHLALPVIDRSLAQLRERELVPFVAAIDAGARVVMTSHIVLPQLDPANPATMSRSILQDLLRTELGFTGVIVSDALDMAGARSLGGVGETAVRALAAGCDLLCLGTDNTDAELAEIERAVAAATSDGTLEADRITDATDRVHGLADDLERARAAAGDFPVQEQDWDLGELINTFDISPYARTWLDRLPRPYAVVRLEARPNSATGPTPWGPLTTADKPPDAEAVLVVGRDIHRHAFARDAVDRLRDDHDHVLVVDLGWPSDDRRYADIATFGSSRVMGAALLALLATP